MWVALKKKILTLFPLCISTCRFISCCDLIQSRFCSRDFRAYDIIGVKINRAFRVHNQILRLKFEEKLQMFLGKETFSEAE